MTVIYAPTDSLKRLAHKLYYPDRDLMFIGRQYIEVIYVRETTVMQSTFKYYLGNKSNYPPLTYLHLKKEKICSH